MNQNCVIHQRINAMWAIAPVIDFSFDAKYLNFYISCHTIITSFFLYTSIYI